MENIIITFKSFLYASIFIFSSLLYAEQGSVNISPDKQVAIHGFDPVAYFTLGRAMTGSEQITHKHLGSTWQFANRQHLDLFSQNPEKYMPQYGGFCAYAASQGAKADIDPVAWRIIDNKLYLNYDLRVQKVWASNLSEHIQAADEYWSTQ